MSTTDFLKKNAVGLVVATGFAAAAGYYVYLQRQETNEIRKLQAMKSYKKKEGISAQKFAAVKAATKDPSLMGFSAAELEKVYAQVISLSQDGLITRGTFEAIFKGLGITDPKVIEASFNSFDEDGNGAVEFSELLHVLATMIDGSPEEKLELMFKAYDLDRDGFLSRDEMCRVFRCHLAATKKVFDEAEVQRNVNILFKDLCKLNPIFALFW